MAGSETQKMESCTQSPVSTGSNGEKINDSFVPLSGSPSTSSSIDVSFKNSLSSTLTCSSSVKSSFSGKVSEGVTAETKSFELKSIENLKNERTECLESGKSSLSAASYCSSISDSIDSICNSFSNALSKPHKVNNSKWEAIQSVKAKTGELGLSHFRLLKRLGCGDIGTVYLAELRTTNCFFAIKVMDKGSLENRKKLLRAQTEREILSCLDHPFLPTLYAHFETDKFSCLVMEFCSGGDLHTLRQKQTGKYFSETAARFYASEVLLALEYLHMLGVIYRDLKPENVLVRGDGHIMLLDFDLSLRCAVSPTLIKSVSASLDTSRKVSAYCVQPSCIEPACVIPVCASPSCIQPSCFVPRFLPQRSKKTRKPKAEVVSQGMLLPELVAEPTSARSMSFVGTHEYLAPEIIKGEGHGSAVDWWTFGIFLYELLYGKTPFKGTSNRGTLFNVVGQPLRFPDFPVVSFAARDLIRGLLVKDPQQRLAYKKGATEIKQHPFFEGINWALIRSTPPPEIPRPVDVSFLKNKGSSSVQTEKGSEAASGSSSGYVDFVVF
eukprot:TRINITY_DN1226_c0_g1_i1.p1 TRINITY_DN1226_c0_g1~~TRINITY_DN1226_c0_g1_i1.p1  ORF type:complete len:553 (-),score=71.87 TRINITY_DN1226_c0_g1_i1:396-2054(-)